MKKEEKVKITYKEFFEKSKTDKGLQKLIGECFVTSIELCIRAEKVFPNMQKQDAGELMLNGIEAVLKLIDVTLIGREEITAEYMAGIINYYNNL